MSEISDMLFDMLSLEQKTFLSMKCTLYQDNWERLCSCMDSKKGDYVLRYKDKDKARAALYMTKVQLSTLRVREITGQDKIVVTRTLYHNSKMFSILRDFIEAFPFTKIHSDNSEVYFEFTNIKQTFPDILDYKEMLRYRISGTYRSLEQNFSKLEGVDREDLVAFANGYLTKLLMCYIYGTASSIDIPYNTLRKFLLPEEVTLLSDSLVANDILNSARVQRISPATDDAYLHLEIDDSRSIYRRTLSGSDDINLIIYIKENKLLQEEILIDELSTGDLI